MAKSSMPAPVAEWVAKVEGDWATLQRELRARRNPNYDAACFHAQQCVEKYLKARLGAARQPFGKTHDLVLLLDQLLAAEPGWLAFRPDLAWLSAFAVAFRYPGDNADRATARDAARRCTTFRTAARVALRLPRV